MLRSEAEFHLQQRLADRKRRRNASESNPRQPANRCNRVRRLRMRPRFHIRRFAARDAPEPARPLSLFEDLVRVTP